MKRGLAVAAVVCAAALGCRSGDQATTRPPRTFADVPIRALQEHPDAHVGEVFVDRFLFFRVWWSPDRVRPNQLTTDLPTHFEARVVPAPLFVARVEFPPSEDERFAAMRDGTELCLRVRFLRLQPVSGSPVFAYEGPSSDCASRRSGP
jgi:hypothetical protein